MKRGAGAVTLCLMLLAVSGCSGDAPRTTAPVAKDLVTAAPSVEPSPSPSPSPTPEPLSPFEGDPAVQGLRAYLAALADAVNAKNLELPAFVAASTERRAALHQDLYGQLIGRYYPGPNPVAVLGVQVVSPTARNVLACSVESGYDLDKPGGVPDEEREVLGGQFEMVLEDGRWKVNRAVGNHDVHCDGVPLQGEAA
ncbi:MAG: hypothetical protein WD794_16995 [Mycobacteriales bacterium]